MALTPDYDSFARAYESGENQIVYTRLAADLDTPVSLMLKLGGTAQNAFMLESVTGGEVRGRYSIIGMKPDLIWRAHGTTSQLNRSARFDAEAFTPMEGNPLDALRRLIAESRIDLPADLQFTGLMRLPPIAVLSADHPLADREAVEIDELKDHPMVLLDLPVVSDYYSRIFNEADIAPKIASTATTLEMVRSLVGAGVVGVELDRACEHRPARKSPRHPRSGVALKP